MVITEYRCTHLTDHQIAEAFGKTLSSIYKKKCEEINEELAPAYRHLDFLDTPRFIDFDRWFARKTLPRQYQDLFNSLEHIGKIRRLYKRIKNMPVTNGMTQSDIERAKSVPIESFYQSPKRNGKNVICPFHNEKTPSMKINTNNSAKCFGCGWYGDAIKFWMGLHKADFKTAVGQMK